MQRNHSHIFWSEKLHTDFTVSLNNFNHRLFYTTPPQNGQTQRALKQKTADRNDSNKLVKEKKKSSVSEKSENQVKSESQTEGNVEKSEPTEIAENEEKMTLTAKFKKMYKEYWYVLLPVHVVTSSFWLGGFYYLSTSGVDIPAVLESMHFSEAIISKLRDSSLGHFAVAYLCYKIATPIRYTVTVRGTTLAIKYLSQWGYIRPVPSKEQLEAIISKLRDSSLGHFAVAYLCYKIATPIRYTVTVRGTTLTIKYLSQWGYIRPVPSKEQLKQMYDDQKAKFQKNE